MEDYLTQKIAIEERVVFFSSLVNEMLISFLKYRNRDDKNIS